MSEEFLELRQFSVSVLQYIHEAQPYELVEKVKGLKKWKESVGDFLDILLMWFRDVLVLKLTDREEEMIFQDEYARIRKQCVSISLEGLNTVLLEIEHTKARLRANVNFDTSLEVLLMFIRDKFESTE